MRVLVISDIHSNLQALEAVLDAAPQYDVVWNLGDIVGYGANPNEVVHLAKQLGGIVVRGNHDRACSDPATFSLHHRLGSTAATAAIWTDMVLTDENREWLLGLPPGPVKPLRRNLICVHGSSRNEDQYISSEYGAQAALDASRARITLLGIRTSRSLGSRPGESCIPWRRTLGLVPVPFRLSCHCAAIIGIS